MKCDASTFAQMYKDVYRDLYRFALCMMKNTQDAEDAVSDAVMSAFENIGKLRDKESFRSWIFTITANTCKKKLKELTKKSQVSCEEADIHMQTTEEDPVLSLDIRKAFLILSEEEQMIVGLSVFGGYNSKEIGKMLSLKDNTVRSKRSRALEKMSYILK